MPRPAPIDLDTPLGWRTSFLLPLPSAEAWRIALAAMALSSLGLLGLGVGVLVTSGWFWQVAGFSFATVFAQRFRLAEKART